MKIAVVSHIRHPIGHPFMGGMEAHSWHLADALRTRGHDVTLLASGDSDPSFQIWPTLADHYDRAFPWHEFHGTEALNDHVDAGFARAANRLARGDFDVVHNNSLHRYPPRLSRAARIPMVSSMHVPPFDVLRRAIHDSVAPWHVVTVTSAPQLARWWPTGAPDPAQVVPNGIDPTSWPFQKTGDGSAVWAGRITPTKGAGLAVAAARKAGIPLTLFGTIEHRDYFDAEVRPFLSDSIRYGGHLAGGDLATELGRASVLLFTPLWDEPFGLAAIEAMSCGLPIAATDRGAVRDVVGPCGIFTDPDADALAAAIPLALALPRAASRARVERCFTLARMVDRYEALYRSVRKARSADYPDIVFPNHELDLAH